jgi:hypothetical protein
MEYGLHLVRRRIHLERGALLVEGRILEEKRRIKLVRRGTMFLRRLTC